MSWFFAAIGIAVLVYSFRLKELPIMTTIGLFIGCIFLVFATVTIDAPVGGPDCYIDWDGRANATVCD